MKHSVSAMRLYSLVKAQYKFFSENPAYSHVENVQRTVMSDKLLTQFLDELDKAGYSMEERCGILSDIIHNSVKAKSYSD